MFLNKMAFDRNNPADLTALKDEIINDPQGLGYPDINLNTGLIVEIINADN